MENPFGEETPPWWRRDWWRRSEDAPPKGYSMALGFVSTISAGAVGEAHHVDSLSRHLLGGAILLLPSLAFEMWWKQRRRRASEQLLVFPPTNTRSSSDVPA